MARAWSALVNANRMQSPGHYWKMTLANAHQAVARVWFPLQFEKQSRSEHFWKMKWVKYARDCSENLICISKNLLPTSKSQNKTERIGACLAHWSIDSAVHCCFLDPLVHFFVDWFTGSFSEQCMGSFMSLSSQQPLAQIAHSLMHLTTSAFHCSCMAK